ncbi:MAG: histidine ammonia-lyase [Myxococcota bacterium]|jgi:histidine ammonia-lyase
MILLDGERLTCDELHAVAHGARVQIHPTAAWRMRQNAASIPEGPSVLSRKRRWLVGPGSAEMDEATLTESFILGHCAGVGEPLPEVAVRAAIAARLNVFAKGLSGCRPLAAGALSAMLNQNVIPVVPSQGSVGAAGDLAPMAHIAAVACGYLDRPAGLPDYTPTPKEALALINGVSMTAGLASIAVVRARRVFESALMATALTMEVVRADFGCIDPRPLAVCGSRGAALVGRRLRELLTGSTQVVAGREPDAFSIRCSPTVMGTFWRMLSFVTVEVTRELNSASDNPLLFDGEWVEAGNFHGANLAMSMDSLKIAIAQLATLSERRTFRLTHGQLSRGLPSFLVRGTGLNSGFMLAQYTAASLASECKGFAHPASVDTIPTVQHHEDHVSMGTIAARMALRAIECLADIVGIELLLAAQGLDLRMRGLAWDANGAPMSAEPVVPAPHIRAIHEQIRAVVPYWEDDGLLHPAIVSMGELVRSGSLHQESPSGW